MKKIMLLLGAIIVMIPKLVLALEETPQNGLPLVIIRVDESEETIANYNTNDPNHEYGDIDAINGSNDHSVRGVGTVEIILPDNYVSEYGSLTIPEGEKELEYIRGRGNSTWLAPKKPYKIKYAQKQEILGMGSNKEWALIANYLDKTLSKNALAMWVSREFGMEYTVQMVPVEVVMIGSISGRKYLGSYYLTELVDIGTGRVEIPELKKNDVDDITGGYLLSLYYDSQDSDKPRSTVFETNSGLEFMNENPSFDTEDLTEGQTKQRNYIRNYINEIDDLIVNSEIIDEETHNKINDLMDLESTADYFLMQEFFINFDAYKTSSNYLYKKPNGKLYWGPLWDFDLIFYWVDFDNPEEAIGFDNHTANIWIDNLREKDELFVELLKERWNILEPVLVDLTKSGGTIDQYKERQRSTWLLNYDLWMKDYFYGDVIYDEEIEKLRNLIDTRRVWFNENIDKIGTVYFVLSYEVDGKIIKQEKCRAYNSLAEIDFKVKKDGLYFNEWVDKSTNENILYKKITNNITLIPDFKNPSDVEEGKKLFLSYYEVWANLEDGIYDHNSVKIIPIDDNSEIIINNLSWSSSNNKVATIEDGKVYLHSVGDTIISATLFNGESKSYLLHVYDSNQKTAPEPKDFILEKDSYVIEIGESVQILYSIDPNIPIENEYWFNREVENEDIIDVDYSDSYIVTGLEEGTSTITIELFSNYSDKVISTKTVNVTVVSKKDYKYKSGANQIYVQGEDGSAIFIIDADYSLFQNGGKVYIDDILVDSKYYKSESGSTKITFTKEFMNSLSEGDHVLKVEFTDGRIAETSFEIINSQNSNDTTVDNNKIELINNPKTVDNIKLYVVLFITSVAGCIISIKKSLFKKN